MLCQNIDPWDEWEGITYNKMREKQSTLLFMRKMVNKNKNKCNKK